MKMKKLSIFVKQYYNFCVNFSILSRFCLLLVNNYFNVCFKLSYYEDKKSTAVAYLSSVHKFSQAQKSFSEHSTVAVKEKQDIFLFSADCINIHQHFPIIRVLTSELIAESFFACFKRNKCQLG